MSAQTIRYINISIQAEGMGCVNTNGNVNPENGLNGLYMSELGKTINNMTYPKTRNGQLYISNNCIRSALWKNDIKGILSAQKLGFWGLKTPKDKDTSNSDKGGFIVTEKSAIDQSQLFATSYAGLVRGYMLTTPKSDTIKRSSPLLVTDFINTTDEVNELEVGVNQFDRDEDGKKGSTSLFYAKTWGKTKYEGEMCIDIESLRYLALDNRLDSPAIGFSLNLDKVTPAEEIKVVTDAMVVMLQSLADKHNVSEDIKSGIAATHGLWQMDNLFVSKCEGIVLSDEAVHVLVLETIDRIRKLHIMKARGFMKVTDVKVTAQSEFNFSGDEFNSETLYNYHQQLKALDA